ncbi:MAG: hypothetical protein ACKO1T_03605 [Sediminibacterium sp.]
MEEKIKLLKDIGFSDEFIKALNNNLTDNSFNNPSPVLNYFESLNIQKTDFTSLIIEETELPLNLNAVYSSH